MRRRSGVGTASTITVADALLFAAFVTVTVSVYVPACSNVAVACCAAFVSFGANATGAVTTLVFVRPARSVIVTVKVYVPARVSVAIVDFAAFVSFGAKVAEPGPAVTAQP